MYTSWIRQPLLTLAGCFLLSQVAIAASDSGTLTVAATTVCTHVPGVEIVYGFNTGSIGSYSPTGLTGGTTVAWVLDNIHLGTLCGSSSLNNSLLAISGFSVDPGQDWLISIECNGVTNNGSNAAVFSYSSGEASWSWNQVFGLMGKAGSNVGCTITHN